MPLIIFNDNNYPACLSS